MESLLVAELVDELISAGKNDWPGAKVESKDVAWTVATVSTSRDGGEHHVEARSHHMYLRAAEYPSAGS